jgi:SOS response regulatory protein OraA/RecX
VGLSDGKNYKILLKDYESLEFECGPGSALDGESAGLLVFLSRKYAIYRSALSKVAMTDIPKKLLESKLYYAYKNAESRRGAPGSPRPAGQQAAIEPEALKILCALVCDEFEAAGYINDRRYALDKARYLKETKKYGKNKIKAYLYQKRIASDIIAEILEDGFFDDEETDFENMRVLLRKKYGADLEKLDKSDRKDISKAINMLVRGGYKYQQAKKALESLTECEDYEECEDYGEYGDYEDDQ